MIRQRKQTRWVYSVAVGVAIAYGALFVLWVETQAGGPQVTQLFVNIASIVAPVLAALACARRARRESGRVRHGWALMGLATFAWGVGQMIWTYYEQIAGREVPFPSFADAGYLALIPLTVAAMLTFPSTPAKIEPRIGRLLDGLIILATTLFLSWDLLLGRLVAGAEGSVASIVIGLAYPAGDIVIVSLVMFNVAHPRGRRSFSAALVGSGLLAIAFADSLFAYLISHGAYSTGNPIDAVWAIGFLLLMLAALKDKSVRSTVVREEHTSWLRALIPYAAIPLGIIVASMHLAATDTLEPFLLWTGLAVVILVLGRQFLAVRENLQLAQTLERRVDERTASLRASEERSRSILETAADAFISTNDDGLITDWNHQAESMFGRSRAEAIGFHVDEVVLFDHEAGGGPLTSRLENFIGRRSESTMRDAQGDLFPAEVTAWRLVVNETAQTNVFVHDVSERKAFEGRLEHQALHDALTGLPNRVLFEDRVSHALIRARRGFRSIAVLFIDLDDFKVVNDSLGHASGDRVLVDVAERLHGCLREGDTVARLGGDEFALLLEDFTEGEELALAQRIMDALNAPVVLDDREILLRASLGVALGGSTQPVNEVLSNADVAMYSAKAQGKGRYSVFLPSMREVLQDRLQTESDLSRAIERGELWLAYQPIIEASTGRIAAMESLLRWRHPSGKGMAPCEFIGIAEETGLIVPVGRWILEEACKQIRTWQLRHPAASQLKVSVNLSVRQFQNPGLIETVAGALRGSGLPPSSLIVEVTESVLVSDSDSVVEQLRELREMGVQVSIDDFGTGYSSLSYLKKLPIDLLKIDKSFVSGVARSVEDSALAHAIIRLAHTLGMQTTAEGIEEEVQGTRLKELGCDYLQGYHLGRPGAPEEVEHLLNAPEQRHLAALSLQPSERVAIQFASELSS